jgi:hypothetical protein
MDHERYHEIIDRVHDIQKLLPGDMEPHKRHALLTEYQELADEHRELLYASHR